MIKPRRERSRILPAAALTAVLISAACTNQQPTPSPPAASSAPSGVVVPANVPGSTPTTTTSSGRPTAQSPGRSTASSSPSAPPITAPIPTTDTRTPIERPGKNGTPRGLNLNIDKINRRNADQVTTAFSMLLTTCDTKIDNSMNDAGRRAAVLATPTLATQLRTATSVVGPEAAWATLADHHGYTTVKARLGGLGPTPKDTATSGIRAVTIYAQQHGDHGWKPAANNPETLMITLHRSAPDKPWSVSKFDYTQ